MNDLKFAFRQLLKNPGFTAVTVLKLTRPSRLLPSKNAPDLAVLQAHVNDNISASAKNVVAGTIADSPANSARAGVLRDHDQAAGDFDAFLPGARVGRGHRPGQRHCQFVFQDCFIQGLRHGAFESGFRQDALSFAEFYDAARRSDTVNEHRRNDTMNPPSSCPPDGAGCDPRQASLKAARKSGFWRMASMVAMGCQLVRSNNMRFKRGAHRALVQSQNHE
ncbi:MAG: hypothetical protein HY735_19845 [Verrucomicrobia bacterium]|nr:hypothetical protein [Verrucomicrobiota bacterium]